MNKRISFMLLVGIFSASIAFSQAPAVAPVNRNADHDRMIMLIQKSDKIVVPETVIEELKSFAKLKGYNEQAVLRNVILLRPMYDKTLSKEDRLFACAMVKRASENTNASIPTSIATNMIKELSTK
jgi:rRNA-processing protein FCF1